MISVSRRVLVIEEKNSEKDVNKMAKSKGTYQKVAETFKKKGDKEWAKAKNCEGGHHYENAKKNYDTAQSAQEKANEL